MLAELYADCEHRPETDCLIWTRANNGPQAGGYPKKCVPNPDGGRGIQMYAHRIVCAIHHPEMTDEQVVLHECDTPACIAAWHLRPGTQMENVADMIAKRRHASHRQRNGDYVVSVDDWVETPDPACT